MIERFSLTRLGLSSTIPKDVGGIWPGLNAGAGCRLGDLFGVFAI